MVEQSDDISIAPLTSMIMMVLMASVMFGVIQGSTTPAPPTPPVPPPPSPSLANLYGVVTDATTGLAVPGVSIQLEGTPSIGGLPTPATTDSNGYYLFEDLAPDSYIATFEKVGYITVTGILNVAAGNNESNIAIALSAPLPSLANLFGMITDSQSGDPISGASITIDGSTALTDVNGQYLFEDLAVGSYDITLEKEGFETAIFTTALAEGSNELNFTMSTLSLNIIGFYYAIKSGGITGGPYSLFSTMVNGDVFVIGFRVNNPTAVAIRGVTVAFEIGELKIWSPVYQFPPPGNAVVVTPPFTVLPGQGTNEHYFFFPFVPTASNYTVKAEVYVNGILADARILAFNVT